MAVDGKYGRVTLEHGSIGEDEPVVVFRAQDQLLPQVLHYYMTLCQQAGSPPRHLDLIQASWHTVMDWQDNNGHKVPDSASSRAWMG